jgi:Ala-tRNA(Pro) deacylase
MNPVAREVFELISAMGIGYNYAEHAAAATMEDCAGVAKALNAVMPKNIFLCTRNQSSFFLLITRPEARYKTADISKQLGVSRLSFGPQDKLYEFMQTLPGAISPMGLLFDEEKKVRLVIDSALKDAPTLAFHPCVNTMSLAVSGEDFYGKFLPLLGIEPVFVEIHDFLDQNDEQN